MLGGSQDAHAHSHQHAQNERLRLLLARAGIYSSFLADNLAQRQLSCAQGNRLSLSTPTEHVVVEFSDPDPEPPARVTRRKGARPKRHMRVQPDRPDKVQENRVHEVLGEGRTKRQPSLVTGGEMREYQLVGMEWLISLYENGLSGILADEMGLGKTLQCIAFLAHLYEVGTKGPFLIVAPLSTITNWVAEFKHWAPSIPVVLYHGDKVERGWLRKNKFGVGVVVTSFEVVLRDRTWLQNYTWTYIIIDEGHRLKNLDCKLIRELKRYPAANRLLLTGTPLQNNLEELWSLLNFVMPEVFHDRSLFTSLFSTPTDAPDTPNTDTPTETTTDTTSLPALHAILKPFLLRRIKSEVDLSIPPKREWIIYCPLTIMQTELYDAVREGKLREKVVELLMGRDDLDGKDFVDLSDDVDQDVVLASDLDFEQTDSVRRVVKRYREEDEDVDIEKAHAVQVTVKAQKLQSPIMQFRKVCNHPFLFFGHQDETPLPTSTNTYLPFNPTHSTHPLITLSGKFLTLDRLLPHLLPTHKILLFSQMTRTLSLLSTYLSLRHIPHCRLDGSTPLEVRQTEIHRFTHTDTPIFLLSTRAGGLGLNLTAADTVILFDSDWNPQCDLQAMDRVHRIGQTKHVLVLRFICKGTVEERVVECANRKRKLERVVVHERLFKGTHQDFVSNTSVPDSEVLGILRERVVVDAVGEGLVTDEEIQRVLCRDFSQEATSSGDGGDDGGRVRMV
ncbi:hypothetical protein SpCBS45565_g02258 [Spizellomyces sp. 'palustris']|nr:hypothetical protein SpCBS45565_g02258 [Spizellomyces sp. 'palustris']